MVKTVLFSLMMYIIGIIVFALIFDFSCFAHDLLIRAKRIRRIRERRLKC